MGQLVFVYGSTGEELANVEKCKSEDDKVLSFLCDIVFEFGANYTIIFGEEKRELYVHKKEPKERSEPEPEPEPYKESEPEFEPEEKSKYKPRPIKKCPEGQSIC